MLMPVESTPAFLIKKLNRTPRKSLNILTGIRCRNYYKQFTIAVVMLRSNWHLPRHNIKYSTAKTRFSQLQDTRTLRVFLRQLIKSIFRSALKSVDNSLENSLHALALHSSFTLVFHAAISVQSATFISRWESLQMYFMFRPITSKAFDHMALLLSRKN